MDNWELRMETLKKEQQVIAGFLQVIDNQHELLRPDRPLGQILKGQGPGAILTMVEENSLHPNALLAAILLHQIEFNENVIAMLTDLDHRKAEPPG